MTIRAVVFDLGGVLFDWNPEHLYTELIPDAAQRARFLREICSPEWNHLQDAGRPIAEATRELVSRHPAQAALIEAYYGQWPRMLRGTLEEGVAVFEALEGSGIPLFALTNWARDTFAWTRERYPLLGRFRDIVVSGEEGIAKPDARIYARMQERIAARLPGIQPGEVAFLDDTLRNVEAGQRFGWQCLHHRDAKATTEGLLALGLRV